jgi:putative PIN family toxin of toxin-antitoxin system
MKEKYKIVIDTNVFISALRSNQGASYKLIKLIGTDKFEFCISVSLIFEYEDVAKRSGAVKLKSKIIDDIIDFICAVGIETEIFYLWRPFLSDPKDDFVLEWAINSHADFIVTHNKKDFKNVEQLGVNVLSPKEFLKLTGGIS